MYQHTIDDFRKKAVDNKKKMSVWKVVAKQLKKYFTHFRLGILAHYYKNEDSEKAITEIATIDALATLPVFLKILDDLKLDNDKRLEDFFKNKIGVTLLKSKIPVNEKDNSETIVDHFQPYTDDDVPKLFERFIFEEIQENTDIEKLKTELTQEAVDRKIETTLNTLLARMEEKHSGSSAKLAEHKVELTQILRREIFLSCAIRAFIGADNAQKMDGNFEKLAFWRKYSNIKLRKPFMALVFVAKNLEINPETNELWHEIVLYLKGFYQRVYRMMPDKFKQDGVVQKDTDGFYATVDDQDLDMKGYFAGLTKYDMALYYLDLITALEPKLKPKKEIVHLLKDMPKVPLRTTRRPLDEQYLPNKLQAFMREGPWTDAQKADALRKYVDSPVLFTNKQVESLDAIADDVKNDTEHYTRNNGSWALFYKSDYKRDYTDLAIKLNEDVSAIKDPQEQLRIIYKARDMIPKTSRRLLPAINSRLSKVFDTLLALGPDHAQEEQRKAQVGK